MSQPVTIDQSSGVITTVGHYATKIRVRWQESVEAIIDVGRYLIEAKEALPRGEFGQLCGQLPLTARTAQMLMKVADNPRLTNPNHGSLLPPSWRTLYELTKLDDDSWGRAVERGAINPEMAREDVIKLRPSNAQLVLQSESPEWYTPSQYIEAARDVMGGIDLDPASNELANQTVKASHFFSSAENGLEQSWSGKVFVNPPYCGKAGFFVKKLMESYRNGDVSEAILLVSANSTSSSWFQQLFDYPLCFTNHRIQFYNADGPQTGATFGSCFAYFGPSEFRFAHVFSAFGPVVKKLEAEKDANE